MKVLLVCMLVALTPLSSLRIVCFDAHDDSGLRRATMAADGGTSETSEAERECERICKHRPAPEPPAAAVTCVLVADPSCSFLATTADAVMPRAALMPAAPAASPFESSAFDDYLAPPLRHHSPPPRS